MDRLLGAILCPQGSPAASDLLCNAAKIVMVSFSLYAENCCRFTGRVAATLGRTPPASVQTRVWEPSPAAPENSLACRDGSIVWHFRSHGGCQRNPSRDR